ncbi:hypothetical protein [Saccharopolyspora gloriosae]|uniref:hypothetical protein n=1 Tax=Saccharopolyspora gloriosae TaxID=455344 RepID=UPI001FB65773|nr:hypothetical protein [Saccharopolyspora gloriosae]
MASVDDVRNGVAQAKAKADEALGSLEQARASLDDAQNMLTQAIQGSGHDEILQARNMLAEAGQNLNLLKSSISNSIETADGWAGRL